MRLQAFVRGIGLRGPGLSGWAVSEKPLCEPAAFHSAPADIPAPALLPSAERRRSSRLVRLVLAVASEALDAAQLPPADLPGVFASSGGDGQICHELCESLARDSPEASPTRFTNSVHNAPAGYWSIATGAAREMSLVSAYDASFAAGLLEAVCQVALERTCVLLVAYDSDYPPPLRDARPVPDAFGVAFALEPQRSVRSLARLELELAAATAVDAMPDAVLESLRASIPAARSLPLLAALAGQAASSVRLEYLAPQMLCVRVEPCR